MDLAEVQALWSPERPYLNTATYGLPPVPSWDALTAALDEWLHGRVNWEPWGEATERARAAFARLVGVSAEHVATGPSVSQLVSYVAATLPAGSRVVAPDIDFTSLLFPFLARKDLTVETVPLERLVDSVDDGTALVAVSAVQSATGEVADLAAISAAARSHGARVVVDATQAVGWLPVEAGLVDYLAVAAYKWLMSPRGTAFLAVRPELVDELPALAANWWAGEDSYSTYYGPPLRLAEDARRLDVSPAWFSWIGTAPSLELIGDIGVERIHEHDVALANRFRSGLDLPPGNSAIVSTDVDSAKERLERAGIMASVRAGRVRASFHVYNTEADVDAALEALTDG